MRAKVILPSFGLAILILVSACWWRFGGATPAPSSPTPVIAAAAPASTSSAAVRAPESDSWPAQLPGPDLTAPTTDPADDLPADSPIHRVVQLRYLATTGDPQALASILSELSNPDPQVRQAALAGALEFGDPAALPALKEALESNVDPQEKVSLQNAINYLSLPTVNEKNFGDNGDLPPFPPDR